MSKLHDSTSLVGTIFIVACAAAPAATVPTPVHNPGTNIPQTAAVAAPPAPVSAPPVARSGSWTFTYAPGTYAYTLTTDASIAPISDTTQKRATPELMQTATITISATGDVQVINPVAGNGVLCDADAALATRAQQIIPRLPVKLTAGDHWRDSTATSGCRGTIPAQSTVISNYSVVGDTTLPSGLALQIHRVDSLSASGDGVEGQHRILVAATGTGTSELFLDVATGRLLQSRGQQTSLVSVTTSGRSTQFIQHVSESIRIAGLR